MRAANLENIEWSSLLKSLAQGAQSAQGQLICQSLEPINPEDIKSGWDQQIPVRNLIRSGYLPPIGELQDLSSTFRAAKLGQILAADELRSVHDLLNTVRQLKRFLHDFEAKCPPLARFARLIYPLPELCQAIERTVGPDGEVLDTASASLLKLRQAKLSLRKQIELEIRKLLTDGALETYLQDKFFTIRADRYVIPIRLDGRGRVKGSIYDTSDSGQTLYIEPSSIRVHNEHLLDLELNEKLEILRIFRELSASVAQECDILQGNYDNLINLDVLVAKGVLAHKLDAGPVILSDQPILDLKNARHPILQLAHKVPPVANDIYLNDPVQTSLIVSGPNAGGKTVVLKTTGLIHMMAKVGLLIPADETSRLFLFNKIFIALGDPQSLEASLSTFSGHLLTLKPILEQADCHSLVLLDELAAGTEPQTASAMAQAILEELASKQIHTLATTHFDGLKALAVRNKQFRNGSMEFSTSTLQPTYQLILDVPGQSYGLEVAAHLGFPAKILERARQLRGHSGAELDVLLHSLAEARDDSNVKSAKLESERLAMETQKYHWERERQALEEVRQKAGQKISQNYESRISDLKNQVESSLRQLNKLIKSAENNGPFNLEEAKTILHDEKQSLKTGMQNLDQTIGELGQHFVPKKELPGVICTREDLKLGSSVYILSLERVGKVSRIPEGSGPVEVQAGLLKLRPNISELRLLGSTVKPTKPKRNITTAKAVNIKTSRGDIPFSPQGKSNTLDLRGLDQERALEKMWRFVDRSLLGGESVIILIHGHGTAALKGAVRTAMAKQSSYDIDFRPGTSEEGGDGVTVLKINN